MCVCVCSTDTCQHVNNIFVENGENETEQNETEWPRSDEWKENDQEKPKTMLTHRLQLQSNEKSEFTHLFMVQL